VAFTKLHPSNVPPSLLAHMKLAPFFLNSSRQEDWDFDVWIGTRGWRSMTHYDLQHNFYLQVDDGGGDDADDHDARKRSWRRVKPHLSLACLDLWTQSALGLILIGQS
jgi:hypothetical protein